MHKRIEHSPQGLPHQPKALIIYKWTCLILCVNLLTYSLITSLNHSRMPKMKFHLNQIIKRGILKVYKIPSQEGEHYIIYSLMFPFFTPLNIHLLPIYLSNIVSFQGAWMHAHASGADAKNHNKVLTINCSMLLGIEP